MKSSKRKPVIGLIGGIGSGKTTVANHLARRGAVVIHADAVGHQVLRQPEVKEAARQRWGKRIFGATGEIDRQQLARLVFGDEPACEKERRYLERLVHPLIRQELQQAVASAQQQPHVKAIVLDAALLREAGWDQLCDGVIFVEADRRQRLARAKAARGWGPEEIQARERAQEPLSRKRRHADYVVDNSGSLEETFQQVERFFSALTADPTTDPA